MQDYKRRACHKHIIVGLRWSEDGILWTIFCEESFLLSEEDIVDRGKEDGLLVELSEHVTLSGLSVIERARR